MNETMTLGTVGATPVLPFAPVKLFAALAKAQGEFPPIPKSKKGHGYSYAPLGAIQRAVNPVLAKHGIGYYWRPDDGFLTTVLFHESGETLEVPYPTHGLGNSRMNAMQTQGAITTYASRYGLCLALGIAADEDADAHQDGAVETKTITAEQFQSLAKMVEDTGTDRAKFEAYLGVETLEELPAAKFETAVAALGKKRKAAA